MFKKIIIILSLLMVVIVAIAIFTSHSQEKIIPPIFKNKAKPTSIKTTTVSKTLKDYIDPSGFKFKYPTGIFTKELEFQSASVYSWIELTSPAIAGSITIKAEDTKLNSVADYLKNKSVVNSKTVKIADLQGKAYEGKNQLVTAFIDQGVLFTIITDFQKNKDYWMSANQGIVGSFKFVLPESASQSTTSDTSGGDVIFEGEETIE